MVRDILTPLTEIDITRVGLVCALTSPSLSLSPLSGDAHLFLSQRSSLLSTLVLPTSTSF